MGIHLAIKAPRRFKSRHGTYGVRFLVPKHAQAAVGKKEIRISLGTRDPELARQLALRLSAEFERRRMSDRKNKPSGSARLDFTLWLPNGIKVEANGAEDLANLEAFIEKHPELLSVPPAPTQGPVAPRSFENLTPVANPTPLDELIRDYLASLQNVRELDEKTLAEKRRVLDLLLEHLNVKHGLSRYVMANAVTRAMVMGFLESYSQRRTQAGQEDKITPRTLSKVTGHVAGLFRHAHRMQATETDLSDGLFQVVQDRRQATRGEPDGGYLPFDDKELRKIFDPASYLGRLNRPDYFWVPLLGLAIGARLGEIVTARLEHLRQDESSGVWLFDITRDRTKNPQSVRRVPIPQRVIDAGLLDYRQKVASLGGMLLFPFGDIAGPTWRSAPEKNVSRTFAGYLDERGVSDETKVFHSLRKNLSSLLNVLGIPSGDRRAIIGHATDGETDTTSGAGANDVHFNDYVKTELITIDGVAPMARLKGHLDIAAARLPINWAAFKIAADIVLDTIKPSAEGTHELRGGWHTNAATTRATKIALLQTRIADQTP